MSDALFAIKANSTVMSNVLFMRFSVFLSAVVLLICLTYNKIAIHRKFQTRRVAEDSTLLYGEAAQHRMKLSGDC